MLPKKASMVLEESETGNSVSVTSSEHQFSSADKVFVEDEKSSCDRKSLSGSIH